MKVIIFELNGSVCTMSPGVNNGLTLLETGQRDVPDKVLFWIVEQKELPVDEPTEAWELDAKELGEPAGIGGTYNGKGEGVEK